MSRSEGCCFIAGTRVLSFTRDAWVKIETVEVGEMLVSFDLETKKFHASEVAELIQPMRDAHCLVRTNDGVVTGYTVDHPFWDPETETWRAINHIASRANYPGLIVEELYIGSAIQTPEGGIVRVEAIEFVPGKVQTYSFVLGSVHTFFANGMLTHNRGGGGTSFTTYRTYYVGGGNGYSATPGISLTCAMNLYNYGKIYGAGGGAGGGAGPSLQTNSNANLGGRGAGYGVGLVGLAGNGYGGKGGGPGQAGANGQRTGGSSDSSWNNLSPGAGSAGAPAIKANGFPINVIENTGTILGGIA